MPAATRTSIERSFPNLPADYVAFLSSYGFGPIGEFYSLYEGPAKPEDLFGDRQRLERFWFIGDDGGGNHTAIEQEGEFPICEVSSVTREPFRRWRSFTDFIRELLAEES